MRRNWSFKGTNYENETQKREAEFVNLRRIVESVEFALRNLTRINHDDRVKFLRPHFLRKSACPRPPFSFPSSQQCQILFPFARFFGFHFGNARDSFFRGPSGATWVMFYEWAVHLRTIATRTRACTRGNRLNLPASRCNRAQPCYCVSVSCGHPFAYANWPTREESRRSGPLPAIRLSGGP